jgi:hypothetical protein
MWPSFLTQVWMGFWNKVLSYTGWFLWYFAIHSSRRELMQSPQKSYGNKFDFTHKKNRKGLEFVTASYLFIFKTSQRSVGRHVGTLQNLMQGLYCLMYWIWNGRKRPWPNLRYCLSILLEEMRKATEHLTGCLCPGIDTGTPEYKSEALSLSLLLMQTEDTLSSSKKCPTGPYRVTLIQPAP